MEIENRLKEIENRIDTLTELVVIIQKYMDTQNEINHNYNDTIKSINVSIHNLTDFING